MAPASVSALEGRTIAYSGLPTRGDVSDRIAGDSLVIGFWNLGVGRTRVFKARVEDEQALP